jgi:LPS sulfotransferase NodH
MTRFAIIAVPRSGSNLLCTLLNSHPDILCHHEVFNPQGIFTALSHRDLPLDLGTIQQRDRDPLGFLDRVWQTGRDYACVGFKWTRGQNELVLRHVLTAPDIKKIVLRRGNRIKTFISEKIAQQTQQWEVYDRQELSQSRPRITVGADELRSHIDVNRRFYSDIHAALERSRQPFIELLYESLLQLDEQQRCLEFLGVESATHRLTAASIKQNSSDLRDSIANFAELAAMLQGSDLQSELNDCVM